ncbi:MAG: hypothetical protein COB67_10595 [SAR324 cluster bacterium]|uniref:Type II secretion system protein GspF domain-containing protein n=1 Tax=SAR324 cluster bacterium TaxID=2024889 RepID=A0A2A4SXG1_9DELT|nr:MAG: hypothetical protein COB67_10595 [SAR324 cluster bacterium]
MSQTYLWEAVTLKGEKEYGVSFRQSKKVVRQELRQNGYFQARLTRIPEKTRESPLPSKLILDLVSSFLMLLESGISIQETLDLLVHDKKSLTLQYAFCYLRQILDQGESLEFGFRNLSPLFPDFFIAMIRICEKTGQLGAGFHALQGFYQQQERRRQELDKITQYPKIVLGATLLLTLGIILFIVPMFKNIYAIYEGDLPPLTHLMVFLSDYLRGNALPILGVIAFWGIWAGLPKVRKLHPWVFLSVRVKIFLNGKNDPLLYAHSMRILLDNGVPIQAATQIAAECMSLPNQKYGEQLSKMLQGGTSFSQAFFEISWFPDIFYKFISSAEKAGVLQLGFKQVYLLITRQKEEQFAKWSKFIEPLMMLVLGGLVLMILLSIYLPIFDLGNQVS